MIPDVSLCLSHVSRTFQEPAASLTSTTVCLCPRLETANCSSLAHIWGKERLSSAQVFKTLETWLPRWFLLADKMICWGSLNPVVSLEPLIGCLFTLYLFTLLFPLHQVGWKSFYLFLEKIKTLFLLWCVIVMWQWKNSTDFEKHFLVSRLTNDQILIST